MTVITLASRRAAPIPPTTQAKQANELHLIQLHAQACTSLREALRQLQATTTADGASTWAAATARATRGLSALKQGCALSNCVEG